MANDTRTAAKLAYTLTGIAGAPRDGTGPDVLRTFHPVFRGPDGAEYRATADEWSIADPGTITKVTDETGITRLPADRDKRIEILDGYLVWYAPKTLVTSVGACVKADQHTHVGADTLWGWEKEPVTVRLPGARILEWEPFDDGARITIGLPSMFDALTDAMYITARNEILPAIITGQADEHPDAWNIVLHTKPSDPALAEERRKVIGMHEDADQHDVTDVPTRHEPQDDYLDTWKRHIGIYDPESPAPTLHTELQHAMDGHWIVNVHAVIPGNDAREWVWYLEQGRCDETEEQAIELAHRFIETHPIDQKEWARLINEARTANR